MTRTIHRLKTWPPFHSDVSCGRKTFEIRKDDRGFRDGDVLVLDEWDPKTGKYTSAKPIARIIDYILRGTEFGLRKGYVVLGLDKFANDAVAMFAIEAAPPRAGLPSGDTKPRP